MTNNPTPTNPLPSELREEIGKIHGRLHGRIITHREVAKHSGWLPEELQHVEIEDEYIFIEEIMHLFEQEYQRRIEAFKEDLVKRSVHYTADGLVADGLDPWAIPVTNLKQLSEGDK